MKKVTLKIVIALAALLLCSSCGVKGSNKAEPKDDGQSIASVDDSVPTEAPEIIFAKNLLAGMSIEEKTAQMFIARCPETGAAELVASTQPGGYILFGRDFKEKTRQQITGNIASYQAAATIPMFIGVDEEGGYVNRVSRNPQLRAEPFLSPSELYEKGGLELIVSDAKEKCELLRSLGINLNFAPVCDISTDEDDFMYTRSLGQDAKITSEYISAVVTEMNANSIGSVLKHFPGYGSNGDTHEGIIHDKRDYDSIKQVDFLPFSAGIKAGASAVLVSHNIVESIDKVSPASLSLEAHNILRDELGFDGVVVTDDLSMGAIVDYVDAAGAAVAAVEAGNDLLCCTDYETQLAAVISAVESGRISVERIDESTLRILLLKIKLGIITM